MSKSASKTPAPLVDRIRGSKKNKAGSAASKKSAQGIKLNASIIAGLTKKAKEYNEKHPKNKVSVTTLKAVMRRGMGAYSSSHRPTITGGAPNTRQAWAFARVNAFLRKKGGQGAKPTYVQDNDLLAHGGKTSENKDGLIEIKPNKYLYHKSNPTFRNNIAKKGLVPKGKSATWLSDTDIKGKVIFATNSENKKDWFDSTYDDDIYKIDTTNLKNKWYLDPNYNFQKNKIHVITFEPIEKNSIELIYEGSGDSYKNGGQLGKEITCVNCGWHWNTNDSDPSDKYVCHKCGYDNRTYYDSEPIGKMADGGLVYKKIYKRGGGGYTTIINGMLYNIYKAYEKGTWIAQSDDGEYFMETTTLGELKDYLKHLKKDTDGKMADGGLTKTLAIADIHKKYPELPKKYINAQLYIGMKFEMEHTKNPDVAKKIALDHLNESPFYYEYLTKMEKQLEGLDVKKHYQEVKGYAKGGEINPDNKSVKDYFAHGSGNVGGVLVGKRHSEGGIKAVNKSTNQPLEMEGGEVVITRNAVSDTEKREFEGEMLTNREILSRINESGGGVSFAEGGDIPESIHTSGKEYAYGGKMVKDHDIVSSCGCKHTMAQGGKIYGQGGVVSMFDKEIPTYVAFQELFNGLKLPNLRKEYEGFLKENYKINFTQLPQKVRTGLLLGSQKLIDNYINA